MRITNWSVVSSGFFAFSGLPVELVMKAYFPYFELECAIAICHLNTNYEGHTVLSCQIIHLTKSPLYHTICVLKTL